MKKLHVVSILDRSGSMSGTEKEVIGAYNGFVEEQKKIATDNGLKTKLSLILFDHEYEEVYIKTPVNDVPELTESVYNVRGMTSLYDAVGKAIAKFSDKKNVIFFIETDGMENCSKEYSGEQVKALIEQKKKDGWDFNFVGADLSTADVVSIGSNLGIDPSKTMAFAKSTDGYNVRNVAFADATLAYVSDEDAILSYIELSR